MAEVAGLAFGVLGIAGLFTSCIENFNIVVRAREFSEEFELLCTQLALQQLRLVIWGETLGLAPPPGAGTSKPYNHALDRPDIRPQIETTLNQLRSLLAKADIITQRYASEEQERAAELAGEGSAGSDSQGMTIFRDSYQRFKARIRKNQKDKSIWQVTRWSIRDYEKFERLVTNIRNLVDALESITSALGMLARQQSLLIEEIESLSDANSLKLLQSVGSLSSASPAIKVVSDTASARLTYITSSSRSYHTARTEHSNINKKDYPNVAPSGARDAEDSQPQRPTTHQSGEGSSTGNEAALETTAVPNNTTDVPQNQRWITALMKNISKGTAVKPTFSAKDVEYGRALKENVAYDCNVYRDNSAKLLAQAYQDVPLTRRMFLELRNIHRAHIPFISAAPMGDALDKILASIEGPTGTPYEGGVFWITVKITESKPPLFKFHTKIYHPNIDPSGKVCADYAAWWRDASLLNGPRGANHQRALPWFSDRATYHYSLGSLLVALCGLLASPNVDDPLVPEIAEKYLTDYEAYHEAAKLYTLRFAHAGRPEDKDLIFPEGHDATGATHGIEDHELKSQATKSRRWKPRYKPFVWERISTYHLEQLTLENFLSGCFPNINVACCRDPFWYCVALPEPLSNSQREEIHKLRIVKNKESNDGDLLEDPPPLWQPLWTIPQAPEHHPTYPHRPVRNT